MSAWISHSSSGLRPMKQSSWQDAVLLWAEVPGSCARGAAAPLKVLGFSIEYGRRLPPETARKFPS